MADTAPRPQSPRSGPRRLRAAMACMRNEGQFLLEWVAYHRQIGFDRIFVATNDCTDGTDAMLDRLAALDDVIHIRNTPAPGTPPQVAGVAAVLAHPALGDVEWLLHCDADEFLNVTAGAGRVDDLLAAVGDTDAIALAWRLFGAGGRKEWQRQSVLESQTGCARAPRADNCFHKVMFRPDRFGAGIDHMPKAPHRADVGLRNSAGAALPTKSLFRDHGRIRGLTADQITWANACINHYALRAEDLFQMKNIRGDGMAIASDKYFIGSTFWRLCDRNGGTDHSIQRHLPGLRARIDAWRAADPGLAALEDAAWNWFVQMRDTQLTPARRAAWTVSPAPVAATPT